MENCQTSRSCSRPYQSTCGTGISRLPRAGAGSGTGRMAEQTVCGGASRTDCSCSVPEYPCAQAGMNRCADKMVPAMAYVPDQKFTSAYDLCYALNAGTIFPELCKPFCGKRGAKR